MDTLFATFSLRSLDTLRSRIIFRIYRSSVTLSCLSSFFTCFFFTCLRHKGFMSYLRQGTLSFPAALPDVLSQPFSIQKLSCHPVYGQAERRKLGPILKRKVILVETGGVRCHIVEGGIRWPSRLNLTDVLLCIPQNLYSRTRYKEKPIN